MVLGAQKPATISVIGLGAWGSALANHCARQGHTVRGWHRNSDFIKATSASKRWTLCGQEHDIPQNLTLTSTLSDCVGADFTIVALPSSAWNEVIPRTQPKVLISATKGVEKTSGLTPLVYAQRVLNFSPESLCVISGPSFASDLVSGTPLSIVAASTDDATAMRVAQSLSGHTLRIYTSTDTIGVELGGILKNIIAIAVGISDALGYGPSTRAAVITRGLAEMTKLATSLGAQPQTLSGLSGLGDLVMTATDDQSRNRMVGLRLGRGEKLADIITTMKSTAEGVSSAPLAEKRAIQANVEAPITSLVVKVLQGAIEPKDLADALMMRPLRSEF